MRIDASHIALATLALGVSETAHAQAIPPAIAVLALSPVLVLSLAIALGVITRSLIAAIAHASIVAVWVMLFAIASYWVENDVIIWTPIFLLGMHAVILMLLIARGIRKKTGSED